MEEMGKRVVRTVRVRNISDLATEREVREFFSFSGEIEHVDIRFDTVASGRTAYVTFKDPKALEIALLLSGATIVDRIVNITPAEDYIYIPVTEQQLMVHEVTSTSSAPNAELEYSSEANTSPNSRVYVSKAHDVMTNVIAKGSAMRQDAVNKAKAFDEKHQLRANASARINSFDKRVGLSEKINNGISVVNEKVKSVDQRLHVSDKTMAALLAAERKLNDTGSAVKTNRYVSAGTSWLNGAFSKVAKAGHVAGSRTREKFQLAVSNLTAKVINRLNPRRLLVTATMTRSTAATAVACLVLAFLLLPSAALAKESYVKYKDPKQPINERVQDLLHRMTLEEKIGQMSQIERANATDEVIQKYFVGSVLSGGGSAPSEKATAAVWQKMVTKMQKAALKTRLGIPIIYGIDAVHGNNDVYNATIFPHNVGLGATRDPNLVKRIGEATAHETRATGIPYTFAPCVAVCRDPRWGRCYESFSEDTRLVQLMTSNMVTGLQGDVPAKHPKGVPFVGGSKKVAGCAKHFVGDGGTTRGINENNTVMSFHDLMRIHMPPFDNAVIKGISSIMISYSSWNGVKMHENKFLITDTLKNKMDFRGFVITDWQAVDRITNPPHKHYYHSIKETIHAGIDMVMIPYDYPEFVADLIKQVNNGQIMLDRIDDAVSRILRVKFTMGLFEDPLPDPRLTKELGAQEHRALSREAVRKSLVLLKNSKKGQTKPMLPLDKKAKKILVAGSHAHDLGSQCGGWTITWQGESGNNLTGVGTTILEAIKKTVDKKTTVDYVERPDKDDLSKTASDYEYAVVAVGEPPYAETAGDNKNLTVPSPGPEVIKDVCGLVKCVVLVVSGRPLVLEPYVDYMDALVAAWLPGTEAQGITDVLFGDYGFTGKLPRTWFKSVDQLPMNYGDKRYDALFPFGFGLTTKATSRRN